MSAILADDVMNAISRVAEHLPDHLPKLKVLIGSCHGEPWLVDTPTTTVYVAGDRPVGEHTRNTLDALDALCRYHGIPAHHRRLRLA